jgi:tripartite-type tricarboxylate transporter receptor subunit TctC
VNQADVRARLSTLGADVVASTPEQFGTIQRADLERWAKVVKAAGIRID